MTDMLAHCVFDCHLGLLHKIYALPGLLRSVGRCRCPFPSLSIKTLKEAVRSQLPPNCSTGLRTQQCPHPAPPPNCPTHENTASKKDGVANLANTLWVRTECNLDVRWVPIFLWKHNYKHSPSYLQRGMPPTEACTDSLENSQPAKEEKNATMWHERHVKNMSIPVNGRQEQCNTMPRTSKQKSKDA